MTEQEEGMSVDEFLGHSTRGGGSLDFLENWKKQRTPPQIDTFLHPGARIIAVWQHPWPRMVEKEDDDGNKTVEVWSGSFNSHEPEKINKQQYKREPRGTGPRVVEPTICPMSLMIEAIHEAVREGDIDWCDEVFRFEGTDPDKAKVLHAGGLYNAFGSKAVDKSKKLQAEMKAAGISRKFAWQENMMAKCNYIFVIVDVDNPALGAQVTTETTLLGDKVKGVIGDKIISMKCKADPMGREGNPAVNPYCIRWVHNPSKDVEFSLKYKAIIMEKIEVDDEIQAVFDADAPDISHLAKKGNLKKLRDSMEAAYVGPESVLDFDKIFEAAEAQYAKDNKSSTADEAEEVIEQAKATRSGRATKKAEPEPEPEEEVEAKPEEEVKPKPRRMTKKRKQKARYDEIMEKIDDLEEGDILTLMDEDLTGDALREELQTRLDAFQAKAEPVEEEEPEEPEDDDEEVECDACTKPMMLSADTCPHCGAEYGENGLIEKPKAKPRSRGAAAKRAKESGKDKVDF